MNEAGTLTRSGPRPSRRGLSRQRALATVLTTVLLAGILVSGAVPAGAALDAGATREQVQRHGRWAAVKSIDPYYRKTNTWGRNNPSQRLAGFL